MKKFISQIRILAKDEVELDIIQEDIPNYERMFYDKKLIELPTGTYYIKGFYKTPRTNRAYIYIKLINETNYTHTGN